MLFEQILEATPYKTAAVWPLTSHLMNHPSKINKTLLVTAVEVRTSHKLQWTSTMDTLVLADWQKLTFIIFLWILDTI